jgi:hypothetical protein
MVYDRGWDRRRTFQVFIVTATAVSRVKPSPSRGEFRYFVVPSFDRDTIVNTLREHLDGISARSWTEIVERLCQSMWWEWESKPRKKVKRQR